jgi:parallel beta-helix repeat protein
MVEFLLLEINQEPTKTGTAHMKSTFLFPAVFYFLLPPSTFPQGSLTPPGPPAPIFKTLDQVEPRIPIDATHTPSDAANEFVISQPGSYYLTGNVGATKTNGIHVTADGVTIDLNGFQLSRASGGGGSGVFMEANRCVVKNGTITGFLGGVAIGPNPLHGGAFLNLVVFACGGIGLLGGDGWLVDACNSHDNVSAGIVTGANALVTNCNASNNGNNGIGVTDNSTVLNCTSFNNTINGVSGGNGCTFAYVTANGNKGSAGISVNSSCTLVHCTARANTNSTANSSGISTGSNCTVTACSASDNTSTNGSLTSSTGKGISVSAGSVVQNCSVGDNKGDGIRANDSCLIIGNNCTVNGSGTGDGAGVHVTSSHNRIEGNNVASNDRGIDVDVGGNLIIKNSASGNGTAGGANNYVITGTNTTGAIITATGTISADPWANFSY